MALVTILFFAFFIILAYLLYYLTYKSTSRIVVASLITTLVFIFLLGCLLYDSLSQLSKIDEYDKLGPFGDYIGGLVNPLISVFAVVAAGFAFYAQYEANKQVQYQFNKQQKNDYIQNFENIFFNLLSNHHQIISEIDFKANMLFKNNILLTEYITNNKDYNDIVNDIKNSQEYRSRDVFKFSFKILNYLIEDDLIYKNVLTKKYHNENKERFEKILSFSDSHISFNGFTSNYKFISIYNCVYDNFNTDFGHYFRNLYRMIKMIDDKKFSDNIVEDFEIKYIYTSIIRAQISDDETKWLFYNCINDFGSKKFKPLIEKYTLLKIINEADPVYSRFIIFYEDSAFKRPDKNNLMKHILKYNII